MTEITLWGVTASPYLLKMQSLADYSGLSWQRWPDQTSRFNAVRTFWRLSRARKNRSIERLPKRLEGLDEYPAVPYYSFDQRSFYYDSSGFAYHLDQLGHKAAPLVPANAQLRFVCQLIDEAFDEFGLYMVHHNRWVTSAATNRMGEITSREMSNLFPLGLRYQIARELPKRQVRRCPYLFSVAPAGFEAGVAEQLTPPSLEGFPPTHDILNRAWRHYLAAMEPVLSEQPYLLGQRFTLADASAYGQLSMNLSDGKSAEIIAELAPKTFKYLCMIRDGRHKTSTGDLVLSETLLPLMDIIGDTFLPLMKQNNAAYSEAFKAGQRLFNEAAFDRGEALYEGTLLGQPFRSVVKSFQVPVWQSICRSWSELQTHEREKVETIYPSLAAIQS